MLSALIQSPEFSVPFPRWAITASLAVNLLLLALLVDRPTQDNVGRVRIVAMATASH